MLLKLHSFFTAFLKIAMRRRAQHCPVQLGHGTGNQSSSCRKRTVIVCCSSADLLASVHRLMFLGCLTPPSWGLSENGSCHPVPGSASSGICCYRHAKHNAIANTLAQALSPRTTWQ